MLEINFAIGLDIFIPQNKDSRTIADEPTEQPLTVE